MAVTNQAAASQTATQLTPLVPTNTATSTVTPIPLPTNTPSPKPTDITLPTATAQPSATPAPTETTIPSPTVATVAPSQVPATVTQVPATQAVAANARTFYVTGTFARVRSCTEISCSTVTELSSGQAVQVIGETQGQSVNGSSLWYILADGNYVHSSTVAQSMPVSNTGGGSTNGGSSTGGGAQPTGSGSAAIPKNCTEAVAMGLTAEQAAAAGLDRDGDGVACYGN